jgi:hypothetical protein
MPNGPRTVYHHLIHSSRYLCVVRGDGDAGNVL